MCTHHICENLIHGPTLWTQDLLTWHDSWLQQNWYTCPEVVSWQVWLSRALHIRAERDEDIPLKFFLYVIYPSVASWCRISSGQYIGWLWPKLQTWVELSWHKVSAFSMAKKLCITHIVCGNLVLSQCPTFLILTDVVSRQFGAAYCLITTKLIHMSWSEILTFCFCSKSLHMPAASDWCNFSTLCFLCYLFVGGPPSVTPVQGGILADCDKVDMHLDEVDMHLDEVDMHLDKFSYSKSLHIGSARHLMLHIRLWPSRRHVSSGLGNNTVYKLLNVHTGCADNIKTQTHTACVRRYLG